VSLAYPILLTTQHFSGNSTMNNETTTTTIDETFLREHMMKCEKEQIIEILISTLKNEERLRNELDKISGIIR
jgi:hypothetical protein